MELERRVGEFIDSQHFSDLASYPPFQSGDTAAAGGKVVFLPGQRIESQPGSILFRSASALREMEYYPDDGGYSSAVNGYRLLQNSMGRMVSQAMSEFERMDRFINFDEGWPALLPSPTMDMREQAGVYVVSFSLSGMASADLAVTLEGRVLTVTGEFKAQSQQPELMRDQPFERIILLPGAVKPEREAHATYSNGVLRVVVPRDVWMTDPPRKRRLL